LEAESSQKDKEKDKKAHEADAMCSKQ